MQKEFFLKKLFIVKSANKNRIKKVILNIPVQL